jgi:hypothetical protein
MAHVTTPTQAQQTANRLRVSAASYARSARIHVTSDDDRVRGAVDAGVAVEHMAKALLATFSPALLADRNADLDTMLHLTGLGQLAKCSPHEVKTISAHEHACGVRGLFRSSPTPTKPTKPCSSPATVGHTWH